MVWVPSCGAVLAWHSHEGFLVVWGCLTCKKVSTPLVLCNLLGDSVEIDEVEANVEKDWDEVAEENTVDKVVLVIVKGDVVGVVRLVLLVTFIGGKKVTTKQAKKAKEVDVVCVVGNLVVRGVAVVGVVLVGVLTGMLVEVDVEVGVGVVGGTVVLVVGCGLLGDVLGGIVLVEVAVLMLVDVVEGAVGEVGGVGVVCVVGGAVVECVGTGLLGAVGLVLVVLVVADSVDVVVLDVVAEDEVGDVRVVLLGAVVVGEVVAAIGYKFRLGGGSRDWWSSQGERSTSNLEVRVLGQSRLLGWKGHCSSWREEWPSFDSGRSPAPAPFFSHGGQRRGPESGALGRQPHGSEGAGQGPSHFLGPGVTYRCC
uniref:Uncharacterized protein n=1 Tax=Sphaerodactylus townsendi TaxID=933632 RepID=A0ACB8G3Y6_9SAUR